MKIWVGAVLLAAAVLGSVEGVAQDYPTRPITLVVGSGGGTVVDINARLYTEAAGATLGQKFVVTNKTGASGLVALQTVKDAKPDGYTLLLATAAMFGVVPYMQNMPRHPVEEFDCITLLFSYPAILTVPGDSPVKNVTDLQRLARSKAEGLTYGSQGPGTTGHMMGIMLQEAWGISNMVHVPYGGAGGGSQIYIDLATGRIDMLWATYSSVKELLASGKVRTIATAASTRWNKDADVPTMVEVGYPSVSYDSWIGLMAPRGTPAAILAKLYDAFSQPSRSVELQRKLDAESVLVRTATPAQMRAFILAEYERLGPFVKAAGLKVE